MKEGQILDINETQKVKYCVPMWLRDEQIQQAIRRVKARIEPHDKRTEPVAIVCFGPSLNDTWEKIRDFEYVITCSGSHKFLLDKGFVPHKGKWFHIEVDPRPHKVKLLGQPHPDIEYLIASPCHPEYFDHLEGYNVKLWHVFDTQEDAIRTLPRGEWALTGGCSVGLRALVIARFIGFTELHVFGMDGCEGTTGKHASEHPMQAKGHALVEYEGKTYRTTPAFLEAARSTWHELDQMPDVKATFYGGGLVQEMAKRYVQKPVSQQVAIGAQRPELISASFRELNAKLHNENLAYGVGGGRHAKTVLELVSKCECSSVLDYGAGKGYLAKSLPFPIWEYDPAVPEKSESPRPADLVVCTDVLEHIEPDKLMFVLDDLKRCTKKIGYFVIHTGPAQKHYADGRNTHLIQKPKDWWKKRLAKFFTIGKILNSNKELHVVVAPKMKMQAATT